MVRAKSGCTSAEIIGVQLEYVRLRRQLHHMERALSAAGVDVVSLEAIAKRAESEGLSRLSTSHILNCNAHEKGQRVKKEGGNLLRGEPPAVIKFTSSAS